MKKNTWRGIWSREVNIYGGGHIRERIHMVGDKYKKEHIQRDINKEKHIKGDIHRRGYTQVDIHRTGDDTHKRKHIYRRTYKGRYT